MANTFPKIYDGWMKFRTSKRDRANLNILKKLTGLDQSALMRRLLAAEVQRQMTNGQEDERVPDAASQP